MRCVRLKRVFLKNRMSILETLTKKKKTAGASVSKEIKVTPIVSAVKKNAIFQTDILVRPYVSEKAAHGEARGMYTFVVSGFATKISVKQVVLHRYGVLPKDVRMINTEGKRKQKGQSGGKRSDWKKAVVVLPQGTTINIHEGV